MKTLDDRIAQFLHIAERYWLAYRLFQSKANRDTVAWDLFRRHGVQTSAEGDAGRHRRNLHSARKALVKIGRAIVPDLQAAGTDCSDLLAFLVTADVGGGGAEAAKPLWPRVKAELELATIRPAPKRDADPHILLDDAEMAIWKVRNDESLSGEQKMEAILRIDPRYVGKRSPFWAELLGVSDATIRGYDIWKRLQAAQRKAD